MKRLYGALVRLASDLEAIGVRWALIGGIAVAIRAEPRTTRDVDVALAVSTDAEAEKIIFALQQRGYLVKTLVEQDFVDRLATARLESPAVDEDSEGIITDLLFASSGIEPEIVESAEVLNLPTGPAPVASVGHLLALKVLAAEERRGQDKTDFRALLKVADSNDVDQARRALELIRERGFHRQKNLLAEFEKFLSWGASES